MTPNAIMAEIRLLTGTFPAQAVAAAVAQRTEITPILLAELHHAAEHQEEVAQETNNIGYILAMYLLAQFQEPLALAPLLTFFSTPGDLARRLTGDIITEGLGQLLAGVCDSQIRPLKELIENKDIDPFVRGAGLEALLCLVAWQKLPASSLEKYFQQLCTGRLERQSSQVWNYLAEAASQFCATPFWPHLEQAYAEGLIDPLYIAPQQAQKALQQPLADRLEALRQNPGLQAITDVSAEMSQWACFRSPTQRSVVHDIPATTWQPVRHSKVRRNDPCPCGSGKKFKKCCR